MWTLDAKQPFDKKVALRIGQVFYNSSYLAVKFSQGVGEQLKQTEGSECFTFCQLSTEFSVLVRDTVPLWPGLFRQLPLNWTDYLYSS